MEPRYVNSFTISSTFSLTIPRLKEIAGPAVNQPFSEEYAKIRHLTHPLLQALIFAFIPHSHDCLCVGVAGVW